MKKEKPITIKFDGTWESLFPLFPIENTTPSDFNKDEGKFILHTRYGTDIAEIGDYIHKGEKGNCWVSPMNRITVA